MSRRENCNIFKIYGSFMLGTEEHNKEYFILDRLFRIFRKMREKKMKKIDNRGKVFEKITIFL